MMACSISKEELAATIYGKDADKKTIELIGTELDKFYERFKDLRLISRRHSDNIRTGSAAPRMINNIPIQGGEYV